MTYTVKTIERKKKTRFVQIHQMKKTLTINKESPTAPDKTTSNETNIREL